MEKKNWPLTVMGMYASKTVSGNSRSAVLTKEAADKACAAIQEAVGGKLAVRGVSAKTKQEKGDKFPDYFIEAITPKLLAEERAKMQAQNNDSSL